MTTPNSREGIEKVLPCIDPHCDNHGTTITVNRDGEPEQMQCEYCYRERFPILDWHHQELQKAREEERKLAVNSYKSFIQYIEEFNEPQTVVRICRTLISELDQPASDAPPLPDQGGSK